MSNTGFIYKLVKLVTAGEETQMEKKKQWWVPIIFLYNIILTNSSH